MTAAITTIQRAEPQGGAIRFARRLGAALASLGDRLATWSAPYYETGLGEELEGLSPGKRLDVALGWHARRGRAL